MAEQFRIDPDGVRQATAGLASVTSDLMAALGALNGTLDQYEGCWGDDEIGKKFAGGYKGDSEGARQTLGQLTEGLGETVTGVNKTVDEFVGLDEDNAKAFDQQLGEEMRKAGG
ncbi:hypothetical protein GCM10027598_58530 [Amycolatopsis oliviviridis]|uniref:WXG100 family type VII secretion target n=1 Tax=Amycolatopsis oliviviridis TaxID=1471590 RepID=A0ABQ3M6U9_9PSEU|nr:hypothetical protein [Amycolatopsis oliviviridis]GHH28391.1 hypothetical protein GCM10017790_59170 [Amycolatopsis oliviviridis]